jgi:hypothetical protein
MHGMKNLSEHNVKCSSRHINVPPGKQPTAIVQRRVYSCTVASSRVQPFRYLT